MMKSFLSMKFSRITNFFLLIQMIIFLTSLNAQDIKNLSIKETLLQELKRHPESNVQDIYKFLHQAAFGSEHAVKNIDAVKKWMDSEIAGLDNSIEDELVNYLSADRKIVRVNLRPYLKAGMDVSLLLNAFIKTANEYKGSAETFTRYWNEAILIAEKGKYNFNSKEMKSFYSEYEKLGFPAMHHSDKYSTAYKPAYRVINIELLPALEEYLNKLNKK